MYETSNPMNHSWAGMKARGRAERLAPMDDIIMDDVLGDLVDDIVVEPWRTNQ